MSKRIKETISYSQNGITGEQKVDLSEKFIDAINEIFEENEISLNKKEKTKAIGYFKVNLDYHENGFNLHVEPKIKEFKKQFDNAKTVREIANISGFNTGIIGGALAFAVQEIAPEINKEWVNYIKEKISQEISSVALREIMKRIKIIFNEIINVTEIVEKQDKNKKISL